MKKLIILAILLFSTNVLAAVVYASNGTGGGVWDHVVATYDGNLLKIYFNGTLEGTSFTTGGDIAVDDNIDIHIGSRDTGFAGISKDPSGAKNDEIGVWNRALTQSDVTALYNGGAGLTYSEILLL